MGEGYKPQRPEIILRFAEDNPLHGLVIVGSGMLYGECKTAFADNEVSDEQLIALVKSWNLQDPHDDGPDSPVLPITVESLELLPVPDVRRIKHAWLTTSVGRPSAFLESESPNGELPEIEQVPVEILS